MTDDGPRLVTATAGYALYLDNFTGPGSLDSLIETLEAFRSEIPETARSEAEVEWWYRESGPELIVRYTRPETEAEREARRALEADAAERRKADDLATLARLKAMYEKTIDPVPAPAPEPKPTPAPAPKPKE